MSGKPVYLDTGLVHGLVMAQGECSLVSGPTGTLLKDRLIDWEAKAVLGTEPSEADLLAFVDRLVPRCRQLGVSEFVQESRQKILSVGSVLVVTAETPLQLTVLPDRYPEDWRVLSRGDFFRRDSSQQTVPPWHTPWSGNSLVQVISVHLFCRARALFKEEPALPSPVDFVSDAVSRQELPSRIPVLGECSYAHCAALGVVGECTPYNAVFFPDEVGEACLWDGTGLATAEVSRKDTAQHALHVAALWCTPSELNGLQALHG